MSDLLDSNSKIEKNPLIGLVETYISRKRDDLPIPTKAYKITLGKLGYSDDQIQELLYQMEDDADKELLVGIGKKKAQRNLIVGVIMATFSLILIIFVPLGKAITLPFSVLMIASVIAGLAQIELNLVERRKQSRFRKYQNWS